MILQVCQTKLDLSGSGSGSGSGGNAKVKFESKCATKTSCENKVDKSKEKSDYIGDDLCSITKYESWDLDQHDKCYR